MRLATFEKWFKRHRTRIKIVETDVGREHQRNKRLWGSQSQSRKSIV